MTWDKNISPTGWYIASYMLRFIELADPDNEDPERKFLVWENTVLVMANSLDEAYDKTVVIAGLATDPYKGGKGAIEVQWVFEGVTEILPVYEEIGDGCEVMWAKYRKKLKNIRRKSKEEFRFAQAKIL